MKKNNTNQKINHNISVKNEKVNLNAIQKEKKAEAKSAFNIKNLVILLCIIAGYFLLAYLVEYRLNRQFKSLIVPIGANIILAVSLNLVVGFLGELSLGHAGFMSIGAFTGAIFTLNMNLPGNIEFFLAIIVGGIMAAVFGFLIGIPVLRLRGDYLAIVTLAFTEIIRSIINTLSLPAGKDKAGELIVKKGAMGLSGIETYANYTWIYIAAVISIIVVVNLVNSRQGRIITSIRDNHIAAESIGIKVSRYKTMAFVIGAFFAGVAGVINGHNLSSIKPVDYDYNRSINILVFVVLGGMGSIKGSIIAATILTLLPEVLRPIRNYRMLMYAIVLIAIMLINHSTWKSRLQGNNLLSKIFKKEQVSE
ncbi:branched-chain amino acid ABC transporter permease [Mobilitalea sibirica]|uniref:Branched-chain amino acid ABC transporter permease n=1 Tax=Mobilitalea sibirica TaxID=1462919 RepID=A0A8J7L2D4_9FIRM|nr:branched-chain amino acid ABC transporter permease [Mobilitalea sibirica]MBH1940358.1 branched-chain amino acid ABC transporter permease [Mobilitalea sibirica]